MGHPVLLDVTARLTPAIAAIVAGALVVPALPFPGVAEVVRDRPAAVSVVTITAPAVGAAEAAGAAAAGGGSGGGGVLATSIPKPFIGPDPVGGGASLDTLARLDGVSLLDQLVRLSPGERGDFVDQHPDAIADLVATPPAAHAVTTWWWRTPAASRTQLVDDLPGIVGNLEGVPYSVRDAANRAYLTDTVFDLRAQLDAGVGRAMEEELRTRLNMLSSVEEALRTGESGARRSLISLDVAGQGRAVIAVGDLATADYVTFFVPGMYVGVAEQLVDWTGNAETSLLEQRAWLDRLDLDGKVATVAWIGYHTPTLVNIGGLDLAYEGRDALTWSLQGLESVRDAAAAPRQPHVSVVAHSYGSTAAMLAVQENDVSVDALVLVGSPGSPARSVADLKVTDGNVWVAAADTDPIPASGVFGSQPLDASFGAHRFSVAEMADPVTGTLLEGITGHVYYFWPGTTAVRNTALIVLGQGTLVASDGPALARAVAP